MRDTPDYVKRIYADFVMGKTDAERFKMGFEMADIGYRMVEEAIRQQYPNWSEAERKAAVFERIYRDDFALEEMERIKASFISYYHTQQV